MIQQKVCLISPGYSGIEIDTASILSKYSELQSDIKKTLASELGSSWSTYLPSTISAETAEVRPDQYDGNLWTPGGGGWAETPAAFVSVTTPISESAGTASNGVAVVPEALTIYVHDFGVYVAALLCRIDADDTISPREIATEVEAQSAGALHRLKSEHVATVLQKLKTVLGSSRTPLAGPIARHGEPLGAHRVYEFKTAHTDIDELAHTWRDILNFHKPDAFANLCGSPNSFCVIGDGNSMVICNNSISSDSVSPVPVICYYEYYYAALLGIDRFLLRQFERFKSGAKEEQEILEKILKISHDTRDRAELFRHIIDDHINAFSPLHLSYWNAMIDSWRTHKIDEKVSEKIEFINSKVQNNLSALENRTSKRTNNVILLLASLTLISIASDFSRTFFENSSIKYGEIAFLVGGIILAITLFAIGRRT